MFHTLKLIPSHVFGFEGERLGVLGFGLIGAFLVFVPFLDRRALARPAEPGVHRDRRRRAAVPDRVHDRRPLRQIGAAMFDSVALIDRRLCCRPRGARPAGRGARAGAGRRAGAEPVPDVPPGAPGRAAGVAGDALQRVRRAPRQGLRVRRLPRRRSGQRRQDQGARRRAPDSRASRPARRSSPRARAATATPSSCAASRRSSAWTRPPSTRRACTASSSPRATPKVATCISCHGAHGVRLVTDAQVARLPDQRGGRPAPRATPTRSTWPATRLPTDRRCRPTSSPTTRRACTTPR